MEPFENRFIFFRIQNDFLIKKKYDIIIKYFLQLFLKQILGVFSCFLIMYRTKFEI